MLINKFSNVPLYCQLKNVILQKIESGEYPENTKIPSEDELCTVYDISRPTVRQAISELTASGILYKERGKGTYVAKSKSAIDVKNYTGFTDSLLECKVPGERKVVSLNVVDSQQLPVLNDIFKPAAGSSAQFAEVMYLTMQDCDVYGVNTSYIPLYMFPGIIDDIKKKKSSHEIMVGKYPLIPSRSKSSIEVVYTEQCHTQYLQVQTGQALLKVENILFSKSGQPVEYIVTLYRADKCRLSFENAK